MESNNLLKQYKSVRNRTVELCQPLQTEDYVVQPNLLASPPKWHLGHTTWFFEELVLKMYFPNYLSFNPKFDYIFNSYYESAGHHLLRSNRGFLSRPMVKETLEYRSYVDERMMKLLESSVSKEVAEIIITGLNHEQQHQELLLTDLKFNLGMNPLFPPYDKNREIYKGNANENSWIPISEGIYEIGYQGNGFCYDNELNRHKVYLNDFQIASELIRSDEYLEFIEAGGYKNFEYWHSEGWNWVQQNNILAPMYWHLFDDGNWYEYTLCGLSELLKNRPVTHVSFYEATAFAKWKGMRLPTEAEWEVASTHFEWGKRWEWTESAYLPYPGFHKPSGPLGEYNGKFMVNQMVLRGASEVTPENHSRNTYRNYFHTDERWQYTGIRLVKL